MNRHARLGLIVGVVAWTGCSTPVGPLAQPPTPADPAKAANVTVYRATPPRDDALLMIFKINGAGIDQMLPGEQYNFVLGAGTYDFGFRLGMSECSSSVDIDAGGNYRFKLGANCAIVLESQ